MGFRQKFRQLRLLMWKNFTSMKHQKMMSLMELGMPLFLFLTFPMLKLRSGGSGDGEGGTQQIPLKTSRLLELKQCFRPNAHGRLAYAPNTVLIQQIIAQTEFRGKAKGFASIDDLNRFASKNDSFEVEFIAGVLFDEAFASGRQKSHVRYTIRPPKQQQARAGNQTDVSATFDWATDRVYEKPGIMGFGGFDFTTFRSGGWLSRSNEPTAIEPNYLCSGLLFLQNELDKGITAALSNGAPQESIAVKLQPFPYPAHEVASITSLALTMITYGAFAMSLLQLMRRVVLEKELKLKEYMRTMGLNRIVNWAGHFFTSFSVFLVLISVATGCSCIPIHGSAFLPKSNPFLIFCFLLLYISSIITFGFVITCFFKTGNWASIVGFMIYELTVIPYFVSLFVKFSPLVTGLTAMLSNTVMGYGFQIISRWESLNIGLNWGVLTYTPSPVDALSMCDVFLFLVLQIMLNCLITWYVEAIYPGDEGVAQPILFPFLPSYWFPKSEFTFFKSNQHIFSPLKPYASFGCDDSAAFERDPEFLKPDISIENLRKVFMTNGQKTVAVKGLSLRIYPGQITALLGHNGAGKSTTMAMLTGLIPPTAGNATIKGHSITSNLDDVRQFIGLCPQYNVSHTFLTVMEHLQFFCELKGRTFDRKEALRYLHTLELDSKKNELPKALSGGMKRKLCLAVALIGNSEVVMLDEPTSGMDPGARHDVWTFLQQEKAKRTILLSTHYMEEADVLGDRIAILANGRLACTGTPLFLKNRYGAGYHITVVFNDSDEERTRTLTKIIKKYSPKAKVESSLGSEAAFLLPSDDRTRFGQLFTELEEKQSELAVNSFGISVTTMDEVFIKVGEQVDSANAEKLSDFNLQPYRDASGKRRLTGRKLLFQHLRAQLAKRFAILRRTWTLMLAQVIAPSIFFVGASLLFLVPGLVQSRLSAAFGKQEATDPLLKYSFKPFEATTAFFASPNFDSPFIAQLASSYGDYLTSSGNVRLENRSEASLASFSQFLINATAEQLPIFFRRRHLVSTFVRSTASSALTASLEAIVMFNDDPYHSAPIALNGLNNALIRKALGTADVSIETSIQPYAPQLFPEDEVDASQPPMAMPEEVTSAMSGMACGMMLATAFPLLLSIGIGILAGSTTLHVVKERINSAKHLQFLAGIRPATYWFTVALWDIVCYMIPILGLLIGAKATGGSCLISNGGWTVYLSLAIVHGCALFPLVYVVSFIFQRTITAFITILMMTFSSGYIPMLTFLFGGIKSIMAAGMAEPTDNWSIIFSIFVPHISFLDGILAYGAMGTGWKSTRIWRPFAFLTFQAVLYWGILLAIDYGLLRRLTYAILNTSSSKNQRPVDEDEDITEERKRLLSKSTTPSANGMQILATNLSKNYYSRLFTRKFCAVKEVSFGVEKGECFGLLGVNGAGKTSAFQMLTGVLRISAGEASINSFNIKTNWHKAGSQLGYCPQFDALIDVLTTNETLVLFARLRGVPEHRIRLLVTETIKVTGLDRHTQKLVKNLSGGNRRKLSFAVALIGDPVAIILDEPTSGIDPVSRRILWKVVDGLKDAGTAILLSSHSMEECEALCTRIAIMAKGALRCLGTAQHLKSKFGSGYSLLLRVALPENVPKVREFVRVNIPSATLKEEHQCQLNYWISREGTSWSEIFRQAEALQNAGLVNDYSASQSTLEQVFLSLTHQAEMDSVKTKSLTV